ncbi:MAG: tryptophan synthase subunit alpha [Candidatus Nanohalobium sp.]
MTSIEEVFEDGNAFMPFTVAGYPTKEKSGKIIETLIDSGADIIELGIPFSDPMADGPTIMEADQEALDNGFKTEDAFDIASEFTETPIVLMAYVNTLRAYGYEKFIRDAEDAEVEGLIVPDLPPEEYRKEMEDIDTELDSIFLVAQNTPEERMEEINEMTEGFAYLVSVKGTTGARNDFAEKAEKLIQRTSKMDVPRAIGFGVSSREHAEAAVDAGADGVIVGSALIDAYREGGLEGLEKLAEQLKAGIEGGKE